MSVNAEQVLDDANKGALADADPDLANGGEAAPEVDYEAEARDMGWNPSYDGPNKKTAQQFVEDGEKIQPILQANLKKERQRVEALEARLKDTESNTQKSIRALQKHFERETERKLAELKAGKIKAVKNADTEAFEKLEAEEAELLKKPEPEKPDTKDVRNDPTIVAWEGENDWYGKDEDMTAYADGISGVLRNKTGKTGKEFLDLVAEQVKKTFPHKFKNPRKDNFSGAAPSSRQQGAKSTSFDALPPSAKRDFDYAVTRGFVKNTPEDRQQFAKDFSEAE
jgi:hypothetical protein